MKSTVGLFILAGVVIVGPASGQTTGGLAQTSAPSGLYDNFNGKWLDPAKWLPTNPQCWGNVLECVRDIQNGKLYLAARNFGDTNSDNGINWSETEVYFPNPNTVASITAEVTLRSYSGIGCATNTSDLTHTQVMMGGNFFNTGTYDVSGWLILWVDTTAPQTINVGGWWGYADQGYWNAIASYPVGTQLTASIKWDQVNHQLVASVSDKSGVGGQVLMPYGVSDTAPPANAMKNLNAEVHTLNCTSGKTFGAVEATYDNVYVNR